MAATRFQASLIDRLGISNDLASTLESSHITVVLRYPPGKVMPLLQNALQPFQRYYA